MRPVRIMTDSTSDLPASFVNENNITVIPLYVQFQERSYRDGVDLQADRLYQIVEETDVFPKTASPSPADFVACFKPAIASGEDILFIGLSSRLSSTIQNARIAAAEFPDHRITVVDSLNLSAGIGLLVMQAVKLNQTGRYTLDELAEQIRFMIPRVRTLFAVDNLEYLYRGGRCSSLENVVGSMLRIRPILEVVDGQIIVNRKVRGKRSKLLEEMMRIFEGDHKRIDPELILVNESMCPEDAEKLAEEIRHTLPGSQVIQTRAGCVISSHCGPKTFSIVYLKQFDS